MINELMLIIALLAVLDLLLICGLVLLNSKIDKAFIDLTNAHNECINRLRDDGR